jgi:hypothetical protein
MSITLQCPQTIMILQQALALGQVPRLIIASAPLSLANLWQMTILSS